MRECGPIQRGRPCAAECHVCTTSTSSTTPHRGITTHDTTKGRSEDCRPRSPHYTSAGPNRDPRLREGREPKPTEGLLNTMPANTDEKPYKVYDDLPNMKPSKPDETYDYHYHTDAGTKRHQEVRGGVPQDERRRPWQRGFIGQRYEVYWDRHWYWRDAPSISTTTRSRIPLRL